MTIRRILLLAFLFVGVVPATALTWLAFERSHAAMQAQIEQAVSRAAAGAGRDLDRLLYERVQNATTWNHLEVMQDLRLQDVDKRLSAFLAEMKRRYDGVYLDLHAVDAAARVIASSNPASIGQLRPEVPSWLHTDAAGGRVRLDAPSATRDRRALLLRTDIPSSFGEGPIGDLLLEVDWRELERVLDAAADASRQLLVLDGDGRVIAASDGLRGRGYDFGAHVEGWDVAGTVQLRSGEPLMSGEVVVGVSGVSTLGWRTLMLQSRDVALAPVRRMGVVFAGLLTATLLVTVLASLGVSGLIARPVVRLTQFTRDYLRPGAASVPPQAGPGEIGELGRSFVHLIEELQRSQNTLVQASRLAALGEVTALMAHEVRTPVGILRSSAQMLGSEPGLSAEGAELLRIVQSETERLNRLVASMLDQTRMRAPHKQASDVHALMRHASTLLAAQARDRGVTVEVACEARQPILDVDAEQFIQVLLNLLGNALMILPRGGRVQLRSHGDGARFIVDVDDDGPGIGPEDRQRLFEPFVHKREGGLGLGLAVVRQIVRAHGGDVAAETSTWGGARIRLWLPQLPDRTS